MKYHLQNYAGLSTFVALFTRAWIEIQNPFRDVTCNRSPSSRGRGLKYYFRIIIKIYSSVALFTRAWIEIHKSRVGWLLYCVALFTRAWIEMDNLALLSFGWFVALFTRAWIEIRTGRRWRWLSRSPSLRGRGLKLRMRQGYDGSGIVALFTRAWIEMVTVTATCKPWRVALFTRAWIEIQHNVEKGIFKRCRHLYEGVD